MGQVCKKIWDGYLEMEKKKYEAALNGPLVVIGAGAVAQASLPLITNSVELDRRQLTLICPEPLPKELVPFVGVHVQVALNAKNVREVLDKHLQAGGFLLNLSVEVDSFCLIALARAHGCLYLDTCIEPWSGFYDDPSRSIEQRSNYWLREEMLKLKRQSQKNSLTAVVAHGANPGLISHFVKYGLQRLASEQGIEDEIDSPKRWPQLAKSLGVKGIHVSEWDTQRSHEPRQPGEFVNTWSVDGFLSEGQQPAELGWGTHEKNLPSEGCHFSFGSNCAIYMTRPGLATRVRSWVPRLGAFYGFLVTHNEAISLSDFFTLYEDKKIVYRPTCHYAYRPCDDAIASIHDMLGRELSPPIKKRFIRESVISGTDFLGALIYGPPSGAVWVGSILSLQQAKELAPLQNATTLQVGAGVLGAMIWAIEHPNEGIVEAEEIDFERVLEIAKPYLGEFLYIQTDWTPTAARSKLFPSEIDGDDVWQFSNILVH